MLLIKEVSCLRESCEPGQDMLVGGEVSYPQREEITEVGDRINMKKDLPIRKSLKKVWGPKKIGIALLN